MELSCSQKNLIKLFKLSSPPKTGETGSFGNLYYIVAAQASRIHLQNCSLKKYIFQNCFLQKSSESSESAK